MEPGDCIVCGTNIYDDREVLESYELTHTYMIRKDGKAVVAVPGTGRELLFCSAKCLTTYVNEKIAPDAHGE